jgi:hypothetical protein
MSPDLRCYCALLLQLAALRHHMATLLLCELWVLLAALTSACAAFAVCANWRFIKATKWQQPSFHVNSLIVID